MCGIVGCAGDLLLKHEKAFRTLLVLDSLRGEDSTGALFVGKFLQEHSVVKQVGDPFQLFDHKHFEISIRRANKVLLGHNRYATIGKVTRANAHPFEFDKVIGVHNGTLTSKHRLLDCEKFSVDSENLYWHIDQKGLDNALTVMNGAWALAWWDKSDHTMNFLRNKERPLFMCKTVDSKVVFWASEKWMLSVACSKHEIEISDIALITEDIHFKLPVLKGGELKPFETFQAEANYEVDYTAWTRVLKDNNQPAKKPQIALAVNNDVFDDAYLNKKGVVFEVLNEKKDGKTGAKYYICYDLNSPEKPVKLFSHKAIKFKVNVGDFIKADVTGWQWDKDTQRRYYTLSPHSVVLQESLLMPDYKGTMLSKEEWEKKYHTCGWCSSPIVFGEANTFKGESILCPACSCSEEVARYTC